MFDKYGAQFPLATVRGFHLPLLNSILSLPMMFLGFDFHEMLVLGFVEMCPLMLGRFLTVVNVAEVCFLCLGVSYYN